MLICQIHDFMMVLRYRYNQPDFKFMLRFLEHFLKTAEGKTSILLIGATTPETQHAGFYTSTTWTEIHMRKLNDNMEGTFAKAKLELSIILLL